MKDTNFEEKQAIERDRLNETYARAKASIERERTWREQQSYGVMTLAQGLAGGQREKGKLPRIVVWARMFCILFALIVPNLLVIRVLL